MSSVGDTSNQSQDVDTPGSTSRSRVASGCSVLCGPTKKLKFNCHGLPIGEGSTKSSSRLGKLARAHVPICYFAWPKVPERYKDQLWKVYKEEFPDVKESQRNILMRKASDAWKKYKAKLRANFVTNDVTKWKELVPEGIKSEDWDKFCDNEATEYQKELRKRNKAIKDSCERKTTHNTGRDGYARAAEKWEKKHGRVPSRAELWLDTHQRHDGTYAPHDQEFADKVTMLLEVFKDRGEEETLDSGPIYETFGKETRGRVRCIGNTISRTSMLASTFAREMLKEVNSEKDDWMEKVDNLREYVEGVNFTLMKFINDLKSGKYKSDPSISTTETPTNVTHTPSTVQFPNDLIPCKILSHTGEIVGYGRKAKIGAVTSVHGHILRH